MRGARWWKVWWARAPWLAVPLGVVALLLWIGTASQAPQLGPERGLVPRRGTSVNASPAPASAPDSRNLEARLGALEGQVAALAKERDDWSRLAHELEGQLAGTRKELADWARAAQQAQAQAQDLQRQLDGYKAREGNRKKVLLLEGLDSWRPRVSTSMPDAWAPLVRELKGAGYSDRDILAFSYGGGSLNGLGEYAPDFYSCDVTRRSSAASVATLNRLLHAYAEVRPDVDLTLVGYSLGGVVALLAAGDRPLKVVTIDAPLQGAGTARMLIKALATNDCPAGTGPVIDEMGRGWSWPPRMKAQVLNVANRKDCAYAPSNCSGPWKVIAGQLGLCLVGWVPACWTGLGTVVEMGDRSETQLLPGAQHYVVDVPASGIRESHRAVLQHRPALQRIVQFIGRPG